MSTSQDSWALKGCYRLQGQHKQEGSKLGGATVRFSPGPPNSCDSGMFHGPTLTRHSRAKE